MSDSLNYGKWVTGLKQQTETLNGLTPPVNGTWHPGAGINIIDAPYSTCTITAKAGVTYGSTTYAANDILFSSDGRKIYDSTGAVMNGDPDTDGGFKGIPQSIIIVEVPAALQASIGETGLFWVFANGITKGILCGLIDMNGNNGLGTFTDRSNSGLTPTGGVLGTVLGSEDGMCGRMVATCSRYGDGDTPDGICLIYKSVSNAGGDNWTDNGWMANRINKIAANGFPDITHGDAAPVNSQVGLTAIAGTDSSIHGTVSITPVNLDSTDLNFKKHKIATIWRNYIVPNNTAPQEQATVECLTFDEGNLTISNPTTVITGQFDSGVMAWPMPIQTPSRFYAMGLEFSHSSKHDKAFLYYPNFNQTVPGGTLELVWHELNASNVFHPTNTGAIEILDNSGQKIWGGPTQAGRILAGVWRDPHKDGRLFVSTPERVGKWNLAMTADAPSWSDEFPEEWGSLSHPVNPIQHCILENVNNPVVAVPTQFFQGTLDTDTMYRYGAPSFVYCSTSVPSVQLYVSKCCPDKGFMLDNTDALYQVDYGSTSTAVDQIAQFSLTDPLGISHDRYRDMLYIWSKAGVANGISYIKYNTDNNVAYNIQAVTPNAGYAYIIAVDNNAWEQVKSPAPSNPTTEGACKYHQFIAKKGTGTNDYSIGVIDVSTNTMLTPVNGYDIDISSDLGGALAGKPPTHIATLKEVNSAQNEFVSYVTFGDRIAKLDGPTATWTLLATTHSANFTSLFFTACEPVHDPVLRCSYGAGGANQAGWINTTSGAVTPTGTGYTTNPGGFTFPNLVISSTFQNGASYFNHAPLRVDSVLQSSVYQIYSTLCKATDPIWKQDPSVSEHVGCFNCHASLDDYHLYADACDWHEPNSYFNDCRDCLDEFVDDCRAFLPCCNQDSLSTSALGPMQLPGVAINNAALFTPGDVYGVSFGTNPPVCATAVNPDPQMWFTANDEIFHITDLIAGTCQTPTWVTSLGLTFNDVEDIAFDRHGNVLLTSNGFDLDWASTWTGYYSQPVTITNTFATPECLDTDYTANNQIISAMNVTGTATFQKYTNDVQNGLALVATLTNNTIAIGLDLSVDYNSGDYYTLGDKTGGAGLNDLMSIDDATANHTFISDLAAVCAFATGQYACGIERVRDTGATSLTYILSCKPGLAADVEIFLHTLNDAGTTQLAVVGLINPNTATNQWPFCPTGMAYSDICSKWPNNTDPNLQAAYSDCADCLQNAATEDCCYKLTHCTTGTVQYSNQGILDPYVGAIVRLAGDNCYEVERVPTCISPVTVTLHTTPGPFPDCATCETPPTQCYKLPNCNNPADIVYTDNTNTATGTPNIDNYYNGGFTVQLQSECFCREIIPNTCTGSETSLNVANTLPDCNSYCNFSIRMENCVTGQIIEVDYNTSPTVVAAAGGAIAYEITVGGVVPDPVNLCWKKLDPCVGPAGTVYPIGVVTATWSGGCTECENQGATCVKVEHCCGDSYVLPQIVDVTTGITVADIGAVVQADITVAGIIYSGCWEVLANSPVGDCTNALPVGDVNAINTSTVGTGNYLDCTYCPIDPCPVSCVLLEDCANPSNTLTVDGATGALIGTDVVEIGGYSGCWKVCSSAGNPVAGTHWFYGERLGIDFSTGAAVSNFNGQSNMLNYNSSNNPVTADAWTFRGSAVHCATGAATIGGHAFAAGDLMFYTDGHQIFDRTHTRMNLDSGPMHNGDANVGALGPDGRTFPAQGAVVIPVANGGNTNGVWHQYYVIQNSAGNGPIKWSIVDMTLNSGKGEVLSASANTTLVANACEFMCVNTTIGLGSAAYWHFFYLPVMSSNVDWANQHIRAIKFDNTGIGTSFVAVDMQQNIMDLSDTMAQGSGELVVNQTNDIIVLRANEAAANNKAWAMWAWGLDPATALSSTAQTGWMQNNGYNGGAGNGVYSWIFGGSYQDQVPNNPNNCYDAMTAINNARTCTFSPDGQILWYATATYYDPATPYEIQLDKAGYTLYGLRIGQYAADMFSSGFFIPFTSNVDPAAFDAGTQYVWSSGNEIVPGLTYCNQNKTFPDASQATGWFGGFDTTRCTTTVVDLTCGPDGKMWLNLVEQELNVPFQQSVGQNQQITNSLLRLDDPNNATAISNGLQGLVPVPSFDISSRRMGERFPVWLNMPCPCNPANVVSPVTITATHNDCTDCAVAPPDCYKLTECECTGGQPTYNSCSVNDPATMPANMITYGKTWSTTCYGGVGQRWMAIVNAVQALGTQGAPGVAQTVNFSYSFINNGATFPGLPVGFGPALAVEQGPTTTNPSGTSSWPGCAPYNKTYTITHAQFKTEMQAMFDGIKAMFEGMFNTNCGYGANLTVNFTDLGYETGYTAGDPAMGTNTIASSNGTSFTDSNGVAGIGDFRIGFADFGTLDPAGGGGCGSSGGASGILGLCFVGDLNSSVPGNVRTSPETGLLLFDANEDWRKAADPVIPNSFSLIRVGMHEIMHALGYGHDFLTFGGAGPVGDCTTLCGCPCYQSAGTCPGLNNCETFPGSGVWVPCCPGILPNGDALMGPFSTNNHFATDFPTGLLGPEGIYDRRATCGIYGTNSANYGCEDGVCLQGSGCVYVTHYSDDPALGAYVGGVIIWDDGSAAGERCWEVDIEQPCPQGVTLVNPVNLTGGDPTWDCVDCDTGANLCYTLDLCSCTTVLGAPQQVITTTDLSQWCNGTVGNGTVVEIDLYPGACYEINCTPQTCPVSGAVAVVVTNSYTDCQVCCDDNNQCYELCPCDAASSTTDSCSAVPVVYNPTMINFAGDGWALDYISDQANTHPSSGSTLASTDITTMKYASVDPPLALPCQSIINGANAYWKVLQPFSVFFSGSGAVPTGFQPSYTKWDDFLTDGLALGISGMTVNTQYFGTAGLLNTHFGQPVVFSIGHTDCECTIAQPCTVVTNDLSAELGQVVTIAPGAPGTLDTDGVDCYEVHLCGDCNTALCTPVGAVTVTGTYPTCPDCDNASLCDCYRLVDCTDANNIINNVCQSTDLANAFSQGQIVQINNNTAQCWIVECEDPLVCDPGTCVTVNVSNTFWHCQECTDTFCYECASPGSCLCTVAAGCGAGTYPDCPTMFLNEPDCCPTVLGYNCVGPSSGPCSCDPCYTLPCDYSTLVQCQNAPAPSCCSTIDESWNCLWDVQSSSYICVDPGDGTGTFPTNAACVTAVNNNVQPCYVESWNCVTNGGVSVCQDPGDGSGTWNNTNGGLVACQACNGCILDPTCVGVVPNYDCHETYGCVMNYNGTGAYADLQTCVEHCPSHDPEEGTFEAECENCLDEIDMKKFFDKVADVCDDCNVPFGLTDQEVTCDTGCFGNSNIYVFLDVTSVFGGTFTNRLQKCIDFKQNVIIPAYQQIQAEYPSYKGKLYIIPGAWPHGQYFGPCNDCNNTGAAAPGSPTAPEDWLGWAMYPLSGNKGANGAGANPMATGTLPANKRVVMGHTMVDAIGGSPWDCNNPAYIASQHGPLLEEIFILPGSYADDGFTQVNPWADPAGKEGFSDPYHEFQGGDTDAICIIFQDESRNPGQLGYYEEVAVNQFTGSCGTALWAGVQASSWNGMGMGSGGPDSLSTRWKTDYNHYMELHQYGWDSSGNLNSLPWNVTQKTMIYAGSYATGTNPVHNARVGFIYHMFGAVGAQSKDANISYQGHIDCQDYVGVPTVFGFQCDVATDITIPNPYMGASAGGDATHTTGYQGGSLSKYGMTFHIPDDVIMNLNSSMLYELWKEYLSDC